MGFLLLMSHSSATSGEALNLMAKTSTEENAVALTTCVNTHRPLCGGLESSVTPDTIAASFYEKRLYLKTNLVGWGMLIGNIGLELTSGSRWSAALHGYYSAWDYFRSDVKFRTFAMQTELRYWFTNATHNGWFVAGHLGLALWNYALGGEYRRQDHKGNTPAYGGGFNFGYRKAMGERWHVEFSTGVGVYHAIYDKFINARNGEKLENAVHHTWVGLDNLAVSFVYNFNISG
jgi:hypothetical protein